MSVIQDSAMSSSIICSIIMLLIFIRVIDLSMIPLLSMILTSGKVVELVVSCLMVLYISKPCLHPANGLRGLLGSPVS